MSNKSNFIGFLGVLIMGVAIGAQIPNLFQVKKYMVIRIANDSTYFNSNVNHEGDTYTIIIGKDTVDKAIVKNFQWVDR